MFALSLATTGYVTDSFALVTLNGSFFWMLRSDTKIDGSRAGCCMVRFKRYKSKGVGYIPKQCTETPQFLSVVDLYLQLIPAWPRSAVEMAEGEEI